MHIGLNLQESCAIAKMTKRCALHKWIEWAVVEIWLFKIIQDGGGSATNLWFDVTENSAIRSADPENPTLEQNMKWIGRPVVEIWPFKYLGGIWNPHFGGKGGRRGSAMAPFERAMVVSYRLSIVTAVLSVTIRTQFAIECLQCSNQQAVGHFGPKFQGAPLGVDPWYLGLQRANIPG